DQWKQLVGWVANLIDFFPKHPFSFGLGFVAEGLMWMAWRALGTLPGIAALAPGSETLKALDASQGSTDAYSALVAGFKPGTSLLARMRDAGVHRFFGAANDLVVPTEGGWRFGGDGERAIGAENIGCFGPDGNLAASADAIHHVNFFAEPRSVDFIAESLLQLPRSSAPYEAARPVPVTRGRARPVLAAGASKKTASPKAPARSRAASRGTDRFELVLLGGSDGGEAGRTGGGQLMASYGGARVVEPFATKGGEAGERMRKLIATHEQILAFLEGRSERALPTGADLVRYGKLLFETLFPGEVRRLYDTARARGPAPLDLVFTSTLAWLADKPWEFAYDPARASFLAIEDVHFVRGVLTPVPAETLRPRSGPLRILVAAAQPLGTQLLSTKDEEKAIRKSFAPLLKTGLVTLDFVRALTAEKLHDRMAARRFDVLHFIGHGSYDEKKRVGSLLFQDDRGHAQTVDARALRQLLCGRGLSLVVLNACETGRGGRADFNRGVAPSLVAGGIPAVIGNQYPVLDASATAFSRRFYAALAAGHTLGQAAREARLAVSYQSAEASMDWAVPVLYARDPDAVVCRGAGAVRKTQASRRKAGRE
ncbi:MAG: CHAT domain-containing protein, partial [Thermoanaerobaculia bacterium]